MAISNTEETLFDGTVPVSVSVTTPDFNSPPDATQTIIYIKSDRAGNVFVDRKNMKGAYDQLHTEAVAINTPLAIVFDFCLHRCRVRFTNGAVGTATVLIEGSYCGQ